MTAVLRYYRTDLRRAFLSPHFLGAVLVVCLIYVVSALSEMYDDYTVVKLFDAVNSFNSLMDVFLVTSVICYGTSFCADRQNHFDRYLTIRVSPSHYAISRVVSCWLSTVAAVFLGCWLFVSVMRLGFPLYDASYVMEEGSVDVYMLLQNRQPLLFLQYFILIRMFAAGMWSTAALLSSTFFPSVFVTMAAPLILNRLYSVVFYLLKLPFRFSIDHLTDTSVYLGSMRYELIYTCTFFFAITVLLAIAFFFRARRVMKNA